VNHLLMQRQSHGCKTMHCLVTILNLFHFLWMTTKNFMMCHIQKKVTQRGKMLAINLVHLPPMTTHQAQNSEYQKQGTWIWKEQSE